MQSTKKGAAKKGGTKKGAATVVAEKVAETLRVVFCAGRGIDPIEIPRDRNEAQSFAAARALPGLRSKFSGTDLYLLPRFAPTATTPEGDEPARNPRQGSEFGSHGNPTLRVLRDVLLAYGGPGYCGPVPFEYFAAALAADPYPDLTVVGKTGVVPSTYRSQGIGRHLNCSIVDKREVASVPAGTAPPASFVPPVAS